MTGAATGTASRLWRGCLSRRCLSRPRQTRQISVLLVAGLLAVGFVLPLTPASAGLIGTQVGDNSSQLAGGMQLLSTDLGVTAEGTVHLKLQLPGVVFEHDELSVNIHERVKSEAGFLASAQDQSLASVLHTQVFLVNELEPNAIGVIDLPLHINAAPTGIATDSEAERERTNEANPEVPVARLVDKGVYPVAIELRTQSQQLVARIVTYVVLLPTQDDATASNSTGSVSLNVLFTANLSPDRAAEEQSSAELNDWLDVLGRHRAVPVLVSITPTLLIDRSIADSAHRFVRDANYPVDLGALAAANLDSEIDQLFRLGEQSLEMYGLLADADLWVGNQTTSSQEIAVRAKRGVLYTILPASILTSSPRPGSQPAGSTAVDNAPIREPVRVAFSTTENGDTDANDNMVRSLVTSQLIEIQPTDTPGAAAQRLLAHLAVIAFDETHHKPTDVVVVDLTDANHSPQLAETILATLEQLPFIQALTADEAINKLQEVDSLSQPQMLYLPTHRQSELSPLVRDGYFAVRRQLDSYRSMIRDEDSATYEERAQELIATLATDITPSQQRAQWQQISNFVTLELNQLEANANSSVRLTSRAAQVPFSFQNSSAIPLRVEVRLLSDKLTVEDFDDGESTTLLLQPGVTTREFGLRTRGSGAFLVNMELRSPDGNLLLGRTPIVMQATAPTWAGLLLATGATAFLLMWWIVDSRRHRASSNV